MTTLGWILISLVVIAGLVAVLVRPAQQFWREVMLERARELFSLQRERLEAKFFDLAASTGKPKGLKWEDCQFQNPVHLVRDRQTGQLTAFVEVTIRFSAIEGGGMEEVPAVKDLRNATAVFHYHNGHWGTGGRALFNMDPTAAIDHFQQQFEEIPLRPR